MKEFVDTEVHNCVSLKYAIELRLSKAWPKIIVIQIPFLAKVGKGINFVEKVEYYEKNHSNTCIIDQYTTSQFYF